MDEREREYKSSEKGANKEIQPSRFSPRWSLTVSLLGPILLTAGILTHNETATVGGWILTTAELGLCRGFIRHRRRHIRRGELEQLKTITYRLEGF